MINAILIFAILYLYWKLRILNACLIENNVEIHEINKTIDEIKNKIEEMKKTSSNE